MDFLYLMVPDDDGEDDYDYEGEANEWEAMNLRRRRTRV